MATHSNPLFLTILTTTICLFLSQLGNARASSSQRFIMPLIKNDNAKPQYQTRFYLGEPYIRVDLAIDLGTPFTWFACNAANYRTQSSKTYRPIPCRSSKCQAYTNTNTVRCSNNRQICRAHAYNPWTHTGQPGGLIEDQIRDLYSGNTTSRYGDYSMDLIVPSFPFTCAPKALVKDLPEDVQGVLSLAPCSSALPSHLSKSFRLPNKFALCINHGNDFGYNGALIFGGGPYYLDRDNPRDYSKSLITTPLLVNPKKTSTDDQYYINVRTIKVDGTPARFNHSLLALDKHHGVGGTTLSISDPYTTLQSEIYKALVNVFLSKATAMNITKVAPVSPFGACFRSTSITDDKWGRPNIPIIDFILDGKSPLLSNKNARWRVYARNSMVQVSDKVSCLGFVDGGAKPKASIIIGGKQMEDTFVEFDLESSRLGINYDPVRLGESCTQFYLSVLR